MSLLAERLASRTGRFHDAASSEGHAIQSSLSLIFGKTCKNPNLILEVSHPYGEYLIQINARPELNYSFLSTILLVMISCVYEFSDETYCTFQAVLVLFIFKT